MGSPRSKPNDAAHRHERCRPSQRRRGEREPEPEPPDPPREEAAHVRRAVIVRCRSESPRTAQQVEAFEGPHEAEGVHAVELAMVLADQRPHPGEPGERSTGPRARRPRCPASARRSTPGPAPPAARPGAGRSPASAWASAGWGTATPPSSGPRRKGREALVRAPDRRLDEVDARQVADVRLEPAKRLGMRLDGDDLRVRIQRAEPEDRHADVLAEVDDRSHRLVVAPGAGIPPRRRCPSGPPAVTNPRGRSESAAAPLRR